MSRLQPYYLDVHKFPGPVTKEDLIGTYWKCYKCGEYHKITSEGIINHVGKDHFQRLTLGKLFYYWEKNNKLFLDILHSVHSRT